ncbi:MAG: DEAD/DEAH box helicase family protein [Desulfitobacteriia bacterium]|jgi:competence protein ComFA
MFFYLAASEPGNVYWTPIPSVDKLLRNAEMYLQPGLPLEFLQSNFQKLYSSDLEEIKRSFLKLLTTKSSLPVVNPCWLKIDSLSPGYEEGLGVGRENLYLQLLQVIEGRLLTEGELPSLARALGLKTPEIVAFLHKAVILKKGNWVPGVYRPKNLWQCQRCGDNNIEAWPSVYGMAATCHSCQGLGPLTSLQAVYKPMEKTEIRIEEKVDKVGSQPEIRLKIKLTPAQKELAFKLLEYHQQERIKEVLVWAACGAGKTEITFPLIKHYLENNKKILFAAPRRDVVHDVEPRLRNNFEPYQIKVLSGAVEPNWEQCSLTIATTHQVLRFYRAFELIIFDENDAYPYAGSKFLEYGIKRALKIGGKIVYLTATPAESLLKKTRTGEVRLLRLPARHHGHPLPVPEIIKINLRPGSWYLGLFRSQQEKKLRELLSALAAKGPVIIFVPTVALVHEGVQKLKTLFKDKRIAGSWSSDPERQKKVDALRAGRYDLFVSTTILERGITVSAAQVAVFFADHELFDTRSLVQMAGRVGRTVSCPRGRAVFIAGQKTKAMTEAIHWIKEQNALALKEGYIRVRENPSTS